MDRENPPAVGTTRTVEYDWAEVEPVVAIIESIAGFEQEEQIEAPPFLEPPLNAYVDTDALTTLVQCDGIVSITLETAQYHVQLHGETVEVTVTEE